MAVNQDNKQNTEEHVGKANFETAISAAKFGRFNYFLIVSLIPIAMVPILDNTSMSYVIPAAYCNLELTLQQEGLLNSAAFIELNVKANFEDAIAATKFGKFNYLLILIAIPSAMVPILDNTVMSYVIPAAHCDLELNLQEKGLLNSGSFIGLMMGSYLWGFLGDTLGRRKMLFLAYLIDSTCNLISSFSHMFWFLFIFKIFCGFAASGPYSILFAYVSEFHSTKYRSKILLIIGLCMVKALLVLPILAWIIIPLPSFSIFNYVIFSWQYYMLIVSLFPMISIIAFAFLPETPKYLMMIGKNDEALKILQMVFKWNTGKPIDEYPIKQLMDESNNTNTITQDLTLDSLSKRNLFQLLQGGLMQIKFLFLKPNLVNIILVTLINFGILCGANTLRLWLPQIFTTINEYNQIHGNHNGTICEVIADSFQENFDNRTNINISITEMVGDCVIITPEDEVYINSIIVGLGCYVANLLIIFVINYCIKKYLLFAMITISGIAAFGVYWCKSLISLLIVATINIAIAIISSNTLLSFVVEIFPTSLRAMAVSLTVMSGQLGALMGNLIFPDLLQLGCLPPFLFLGIIVTISGLMCLALPIPSSKELK